MDETDAQRRSAVGDAVGDGLLCDGHEGGDADAAGDEEHVPAFVAGRDRGDACRCAGPHAVHEWSRSRSPLARRARRALRRAVEGYGGYSVEGYCGYSVEGYCGYTPQAVERYCGYFVGVRAVLWVHSAGRHLARRALSSASPP